MVEGGKGAVIDLTDGTRAFRLTTGLPGPILERLLACSRRPDLDRLVFLLSYPPVDDRGRNLYLQARLNHPDYRFYVGRFPVPPVIDPTWLPALAEMDRLWVPTRTGRETLLKAGLPAARVEVIPSLVTIRDAGAIRPYPLRFDRPRPFSLLAFVDREDRTGWREVLSAWLGAFEPEEPAALVLAPRPGRGRLRLSELVATAVRGLGRDPARIPQVLLVEEEIGQREILSLCRAVDTMVVPRDEDERGLVALHAMAAGIAPIGWSQGVLSHLLHSSRSFPLAAGDNLEYTIHHLARAVKERHRRGGNAIEYVTRSHAPGPVHGKVARSLADLAAMRRPDRAAGGGGHRVATRAAYRRELAGGADPAALHYQPEPVPDAWLQPPLRVHEEYAREGLFAFLCAPDRLEGSGWEELVAVYSRTFSGQDDLVLHLVVPPSAGADAEAAVAARLPELLARGGGPRRPPRVEVHGPVAPAREAEMMAAVQVAVLPAGEEGLLRFPRLAMASGTPAIVPGLGDYLDYCGEPGTARLLFMRRRSDGRWEADPDDLSRALVEARENRGVFKGMGERARSAMAGSFSAGALADRPAPASDHPTVVFEGPVFRAGSQAIILRELVRALAADTGLRPLVRHTGPAEWPPEGEGPEGELLPLLARREPVGAELVVRGGWPPLFRQPLSHHFIMRIDWEWGRIPLSWLEPLAGVDEVWVHSRHVFRSFAESGLDPDKLFLLPHGVDPGVMNPEGPALAALREEIGERHAFLFLGGTLFRKGIDVLLAAYGQAFGPDDPVCLVVKEVGVDDFYGNNPLAGLVERFAETPGAPKVIRAPEKLTLAEVAALYRSVDTLVHPYRGEGFGLPVLEAMAVGLPVVVTAGGATDDFARGDSVLALPARRREVELDEPCAGMPWVLEPDREELVRLLQRALAERRELERAARSLSGEVRRRWSWSRTAELAAARLAAAVAEIHSPA